eukprot:gene10355-2490_t
MKEEESTTSPTAAAHSDLQKRNNLCDGKKDGTKSHKPDNEETIYYNVKNAWIGFTWIALALPKAKQIPLINIIVLNAVYIVNVHCPHVNVVYYTVQNRGMNIIYNSRFMSDKNCREDTTVRDDELPFCARDDCPRRQQPDYPSKFCSDTCQMIVGHRLVHKFLQRVAPGNNNGIPQILVNRLQEDKSAYEKYKYNAHSEHADCKNISDSINSFDAGIPANISDTFAEIAPQEHQQSNTSHSKRKSEDDLCEDGHAAKRSNNSLVSPLSASASVSPADSRKHIDKDNVELPSSGGQCERENMSSTKRDDSKMSESPSTLPANAASDNECEDGCHITLDTWEGLQGTYTCFICARDFSLINGLKHLPQCFKITEGKFLLLGDHPIEPRFCPIKAFCNVNFGKEKKICQQLDAFCFMHSQNAKAMWKIDSQRACGFFARGSPCNQYCQRKYQDCAEHFMWQFTRYGTLCKDILSESYLAEVAWHNIERCSSMLAQQHMFLIHAMYNINEVEDTSKLSLETVQNTHPFQQQLPHHDNVDPPEWLKRRTEADPFVHDNVRPFVTFGTKALPKRHWR